MPHWFTHIPIYSRSRVRLRQRQKIASHIRKYGEYRLDKDRAVPKPVSLQLLYDPSFGKSAIISGKETKVFGIKDIAKLYKLSYDTPLKWYQDGYLPDPYLERKQGRGNSPVYILLQMRAIVRVLNDIYGQGVRNIAWERLEGHLDMMDKGCEMAVETFGRGSLRQQRIEAGGEFGVAWEES